MGSTYCPDTRLLIAGEWCDAASGKILNVIHPASGEVIGRVNHASIPNLDRALAVAQSGFEAWRLIPAHEQAAPQSNRTLRSNEPCRKSGDAETAVREYQQLSPLMPPGTLVTYLVWLTAVVDFRAGYDASEWSEPWEEFYCDWREL